MNYVCILDIIDERVVHVERMFIVSIDIAIWINDVTSGF